MADQNSLFLQPDCPILVKQAGRNFSFRDVLGEIGSSEEVFQSCVDIQRVPRVGRADFTGTLPNRMAGLVVKAIDISQPQSKLADEADSEDEDSDGEDDKLQSAYLSNGLVQTSKPAKTGMAESRMTKFTIFDGVNKFEAMEYELLNMVHDFKQPGLILALKPPITVRKGMLLLKKQNCQVVYQADKVFVQP